MEDAMSEEPEPTQPDPPAENPDEPLGEAGIKALQAEREARKAAERERDEAKAKAQKWDEVEEAQKTELERAREAAAKAEEDALQARTEALRYRIANKHKLSEEDADFFLTGADEETLTKQAERLVALKGEKQQVEQQKPDPSQGPRTTPVRDPKEAGRARARARFGDPGK